MNNVNKELPKALTIEDLKEKIGKPVFVVGLIYGNKNWRVLKSIEVNKLNIITFTDNSKISAENQDKFRFFDEEVTHQELAEILEAEEKEKKTGYERTPKERYYTVSGKIQTVNHCDNVDNFDDEKYNIANYFNNNPLCENIARAERLKYQLRRFAALNGGIPSVADWFTYYSWDEGSNWKYFIEYDYENQKMHINYVLTDKSFGQVYFKSEEACKKAVETFKDELLWYFTEFKEMLY